MVDEVNYGKRNVPPMPERSLNPTPPKIDESSIFEECPEIPQAKSEDSSIAVEPPVSNLPQNSENEESGWLKYTERMAELREQFNQIDSDIIGNSTYTTRQEELNNFDDAQSDAVTDKIFERYSEYLNEFQSNDNENEQKIMNNKKDVDN